MIKLSLQSVPREILINFFIEISTLKSYGPVFFSGIKAESEDGKSLEVGAYITHVCIDEEEEGTHYFMDESNAPIIRVNLHEEEDEANRMIFMYLPELHSQKLHKMLNRYYAQVC